MGSGSIIPSYFLLYHFCELLSRIYAFGDSVFFALQLHCSPLPFHSLPKRSFRDGDEAGENG